MRQRSCRDTARDAFSLVRSVRVFVARSWYLWKLEEESNPGTAPSRSRPFGNEEFQIHGAPRSSIPCRGVQRSESPELRKHEPDPVLERDRGAQSLGRPDHQHEHQFAAVAGGIEALVLIQDRSIQVHTSRWFSVAMNSFLCILKED